MPYDDSLNGGIESRYKSLTDSKVDFINRKRTSESHLFLSQTIVEFLDKSRTVNSRTHTVSSAPAPTLTPATIAATMTCKIIVDIIHSENADPNKLFFLNARDDASLIRLSKGLLPFLSQKQKGLANYLHQAETQTVQVSDKVKSLWRDKLDAINTSMAVLFNADKSEAQLDEESKGSRLAFFEAARQAWEVNLKVVLTQLSNEMIGPFALGMLVSH